MENAVEKFDPSTLMQGVKDRIKSTFVSLISDGHWEQMVKREIENFTLPSSDRWGNRTDSEFTKIVHEELKKILQEKVKTELKAFIGDTYNKEITPKLEKMIKENIGEMFTNMIGNMIQGAIYQMQQQNTTY